MILQPDNQNSSWAIFELGEDGSLLRSFSLNYSIQAEAQLYMGLADFTSSRWQFQPAPPDGEVISVTDSLYSPSGRSYLCLFAPASDGNVSIYKLDVELDNGWQSRDVGVALPGYTVQSPLGAVSADGHPAVAYFDNAGLRYLRSESPEGLAAGDWPEPLLLVPGATGQWIDMQLIGGNPAIAFHAENSSQLSYLRSTTASGAAATDWTAAVKIDDAPGGHVPECSLAQVDGNPALAYLSADNNLSYRRSTTADGAAMADWQNKLLLHADGGVSALNPSLKLIRGKPAVSFYDKQHGRQLYMASSTASGSKASAWPSQPAVVAAGQGIEHSWADLCSLDGRPSLFFMHLDSSVDNDPFLPFRQARQGDGNADTDWDYTSHSFLSPSPGSGLLSSIGLGDHMLIGYSRDTISALRVYKRRELDDTPNFSFIGEEVETGGSAVLTFELFEIDGAPAVFYLRDDDQLVYARDFTFLATQY
ncbi:MAG: hypothetical protein R3F46_01430 [bacterium]